MPRHFMRLLENVIPKVYCILCLDKINTLYALLGILRNAQAFYETPTGRLHQRELNLTTD
jgi:hypothetical protein